MTDEAQQIPCPAEHQRYHSHSARAKAHSPVAWPEVLGVLHAPVAPILLTLSNIKDDYECVARCSWQASVLSPGFSVLFCAKTWRTMKAMVAIHKRSKFAKHFLVFFFWFFPPFSFFSFFLSCFLSDWWKLEFTLTHQHKSCLLAQLCLVAPDIQRIFLESQKCLSDVECRCRIGLPS